MNNFVIQANLIRAVRLTPPLSGHIVRAGSPISAAGAVANNAYAIGILLEDVDFQSYSVRYGEPIGCVLVDGFIDTAKAQTASGLTFEATMKRAVPAITFVDSSGHNSPTVPANMASTTANNTFSGNNTFKPGGIILQSSTESSTKLFRLSVNDAGTISATEITEG